MSNTLIITCAGKSSRFPNMRPKWMLTHPDGNLMIEKAISGIDTSYFDRIIITTVKEHQEEFEADIWLEQLYENNEKIEICILDTFTSSQSESTFLTIKKMNVTGAFVVKDADNYVKVNLNIKQCKNFIVGIDLTQYSDVDNICAKSFLLINEQNIIVNIVEKIIKSNIICVGVYGFESTETFEQVYLEMNHNDLQEVFLSHVISYMINVKRTRYHYIQAYDYADWGTFQDWKKEIEKHKTYFVDIDGVLMKNCGKYGVINWSNNDVTLDENIKSLKSKQDEGAQIILVSSRHPKYIEKVIDYFKKFDLVVHGYIGNCYHGKRVLINDFSSTNPYPTAESINIPRNEDISKYL